MPAKPPAAKEEEEARLTVPEEHLQLALGYTDKNGHQGPRCDFTLVLPGQPDKLMCLICPGSSVRVFAKTTAYQ
eukprot:1055796-Pelagomonas_calceolata.AAC.2